MFICYCMSGSGRYAIARTEPAAREWCESAALAGEPADGWEWRPDTRGGHGFGQTFPAVYPEFRFNGTPEPYAGRPHALAGMFCAECVYFPAEIVG